MDARSHVKGNIDVGDRRILHQAVGTLRLRLDSLEQSDRQEGQGLAGGMAELGGELQRQNVGHVGSPSISASSGRIFPAARQGWRR